MAKLSVTPSFNGALEAGSEAFQFYNSEGPTGIHTVDRVLLLGQHANGLLQDHKDAVYAASPPVVTPKDVDDAFKKLGEECNKQKQLKGATARFDPDSAIKLSMLIKFIIEDILPKILKK